MVETPDIVRPDPEIVAGLERIGSATASSQLAKTFGIRSAHIAGPVCRTPGKRSAGPALPRRRRPKRGRLWRVDGASGPGKPPRRHVLYHTQPGDVVVVDARGDMRSGVFGEVMLTYFAGRGGKGIVV